MPSIEENASTWDREWMWNHGEDWSEPWGGTAPEWYGTILPRIQAFLPTGTILEIAPGHGRWTQFLISQCARFIGVDLAENCVLHCRDRYRNKGHAEFHANDGKSLPMVADRSVDFVFSFDSLVHADPDTVDSYLSEVSRKLTPRGVAFIHHSNLGAYADTSTGTLDPGIENPHGRDPLGTARHFAKTCADVGLVCSSQELISWGGDILNDCFSVVSSPRSGWAKDPVVVSNKDFGAEVERIRNLSAIYPQTQLFDLNGDGPTWVSRLLRFKQRRGASFTP